MGKRYSSGELAGIAIGIGFGTLLLALALLGIILVVLNKCCAKRRRGHLSRANSKRGAPRSPPRGTNGTHAASASGQASAEHGTTQKAGAVATPSVAIFKFAGRRESGSAKPSAKPGNRREGDDGQHSQKQQQERPKGGDGAPPQSLSVAVFK